MQPTITRKWEDCYTGDMWKRGTDIAKGNETLWSAWGSQGGFMKEERPELTPD